MNINKLQYAYKYILEGEVDERVIKNIDDLFNYTKEVSKFHKKEKEQE